MDTPQPEPRLPAAKSRASGWISLPALWNWKSAILSVILRVPVFAAVTVQKGMGAVTGAVLAEALVCAFNAGFYAAVVQFIRYRKPVWLTATVIAIVLPATAQVIEYEVHTWRGTPHRIFAVIVSSILSAVSSLFNWYAMRQGTLLVGNERSALASDLRHLPRLLGQFLLLGPRWVLRRVGWSVLPSN